MALAKVKTFAVEEVRARELFTKVLSQVFLLMLYHVFVTLLYDHLIPCPYNPLDLHFRADSDCLPIIVDGYL